MCGINKREPIYMSQHVPSETLTYANISVAKIIQNSLVSMGKHN